MYLFDLHCDTVTRLHSGERLAPGDRSLRSNGAHLALDRMSRGWCQCFAIFMPDGLRGADAVGYFEENYQFFKEQLAENRALIDQAQSADEMRAVLESGQIAAVLTVEGASALGGDLAMVNRLAECGVKIVTLTWNAENELAGGSQTDLGFTPFGRQAVEAFEDAGIVCDVSHLSDRAFWELAEFARRPFIATHSNSRTVCEHPRNLSDAQFRCIAQRGGLAGINFCTHFLIQGGGDPTFDELAAHIAHFLALGGENAIALGSDYDGCDVPSWLDPGERIWNLFPLICERFGGEIAEKIFWRNALAFWERWERGA